MTAISSIVDSVDFQYSKKSTYVNWLTLSGQYCEKGEYMKEIINGDGDNIALNNMIEEIIEEGKINEEEESQEYEEENEGEEEEKEEKKEMKPAPVDFYFVTSFTPVGCLDSTNLTCNQTNVVYYYYDTYGQNNCSEQFYDNQDAFSTGCAYDGYAYSSFLSCVSF